MTANYILIALAAYFGLLMFISHVTGKKANNADFFIGNRQSRWYVVAFGMIGASLSGVTFISVPGAVVSDGFSYMQMVLGYLLGYAVIANVLLPLYYKLNLTSIYTYLQQRFGNGSYRTGAAFFLLSRIIGASFRLYLVAFVLDYFVFEPMGVPFALTVAICIGLIWIYSFRGGIRTIVWTDTLQTLFMLLAVIFSIISVLSVLELSIGEAIDKVAESSYSNMFVWDASKGNNFFKHFFSGIFITIVMTGLDQDMMQKNLSCRNLKEAKRNVYWMSGALVPVNLLFLFLGALLYLFGEEIGRISTAAIGEFPITLHESGLDSGLRKDHVFPFLALNDLGLFVGLAFILGLVAAAYSSADSALTALTTSFCVDFLGQSESGGSKRTRYLVHFGFSIVLFLVIIIFRSLHDDSIINQLFTAAGYTYGPLLGMFAYGLLTKLKVKDKIVPFLMIAAALSAYFIEWYAKKYFGFSFGFLILLVNGALSFLLLYLSHFLIVKSE